MGSVQNEIECPNCRYGYAMDDYYYKSGEYYISCPRCGYYEECNMTNRDSYDENSNWKPKYELKKHRHKGAYRYGTGVLSCGGFKFKKNMKQFENDILKHNSKKGTRKIKTATYTFKDVKGKWKIKDVLTGKIEDFPENPYEGEHYENNN